MSRTEILSALRSAPSQERSWVREWRLANQDLIRCFKGWHVWALLGVSDIRLRYKRSRFGQFWITLSMAIFVAGIGAVYGGLFHQNTHDYIPYLAVNMTVWTFISTCISESCQAFIEAAPYLRQEALPKSTFIMRIMVRNLMALGHNVIIIPLVFALFLYAPSPTALLAIPGLLLVMAGIFMAAMLLALLCTRFRDMPQIIGNLLQLAFFVTPVMWHIEQLGTKGVYVTLFNPFSSFLRVVSEPLLGHVPEPQVYLTVLVALGVLTLIALPSFARYRARIVYWL